MTPARPAWSGIKKVGVGVVAVLGFLGIAVALLNDSVSLHDRFAGTATSSTPTPASQGTTSAPAPPSGEASAAPSASSHRAAATCKDPDGNPIDCQQPHRYETYDGECNTAGLIAWLGGRSDVDVARGVPRRIATGACEVDLKTSVIGSARGGFERADSSALRKCVDDRSESVVACNAPHNAEYVAADVPGVADDGACRDAAADYLGIGIDRRSTELRVRAIASEPTGDANARCLIQVIGTERLDTSVRGIENRQLKWTS